MINVLKILINRLFRDIHFLVWSVAFPVALLIGLGTYFDDPSYNRQLLTGVLTIGLLFGALNVTSIDVLQQRNRGIYKLLKVTPFTTFSFIVCLTAARTVVQLVVSLFTLLVGMVLYDLSFTVVQILWLLFVLVIGTICFVSLGFLVANFAAHEGQVNMLTNLTGLPMIFASEAFYQLQNSPKWVQALSDFLPFTYLVNSVTAVVKEQMSELILPLCILAGFTFIILILAVGTFRWDSEAPVTFHFSRSNLYLG